MPTASRFDLISVATTEQSSSSGFCPATQPSTPAIDIDLPSAMPTC
jgi:hypothetical protein